MAWRAFLRYGIFSRHGKLGMMLKGTVHGMRRMTGKLEAAAIGEAGTVAQSRPIH